MSSVDYSIVRGMRISQDPAIALEVGGAFKWLVVDDVCEEKPPASPAEVREFMEWLEQTKILEDSTPVPPRGFNCRCHIGDLAEFTGSKICAPVKNANFDRAKIRTFRRKRGK